MVAMIPPNWFALFFVIRRFFRRSIVRSTPSPWVWSYFWCSRFFRFPCVIFKTVKVGYHVLVNLAGIAIVRQQMGVYIFQYLAITTIRVNGFGWVFVIK